MAKKKKLTKKQISALEIAQYIYDSESERRSLEEFVEEGNDPKYHVYYHAAVVLDLEDSLDADLAREKEDNSN